MKMSDFDQPRYFSYSHFDEEGNVFTIRKVETQEFSSDYSNRGPEKLPVVRFDETEVGLILRVKLRMDMSSIYGDDSANWIGKKVNLYRGPFTTRDGRTVDTILVRDPSKRHWRKGHWVSNPSNE